MRRVTRSLTAGAALLAASGALAMDVRLGPIEGDSVAGEPVSARIPVHELPADPGRVEVGLAPSRIFDRAGLERGPALSLLEMELVTTGPEAPYIAVRSEEPIDQPLLDLLVRVSWPEGDLVREYTLLLEPPTTADAGATGPGRPAALDDEPFAEVVRDGERERRRTAYGPVERGDTLWEIAAEHRPEGATMAQTMLAILELNPHAFADDNVNDLLAGWWLRLPDPERIAARSPQEAQATYERHVAEWVPPAERGAEVAEVEEAAPEPEPAEPAAEPPAEEAPDEPRLRILALGEEHGREDVLSLLDADLDPSEANVRRLQGALAALREERASLRAERESLRDRVEDLGERVAALERLVELDAEGVLPPPEPEPTPRMPLPELGEALEEPLPEPEVAEPAPDEAEEDELAPTAMWSDEIMQRQVLLAAGGALLAIAAVAAFLLWRRRRGQAGAQQQEGLRLDPGDLSFDIGDSGRRDALEIADEHIADGSLSRARDVLERGLHREPQRADLRLRLLEVLERLDEREAFLEEAQALYDRTRSEADPVWQAARAIGQRFTPTAALFAGAAAAGGGAEAAEPAADEPAAEGGAEAEDADLDAKPDLEELDLELGADEEAQAPGGPGAETPEAEEAQEADAADDFDRRLEAAFSEAEGDVAAEPGADADTAEPDAEAEPEPAMAQEPEASAEAQDLADELFGGSDEAESEPEDEDEGLDEMDLDALLQEAEEEDRAAEGGAEDEADAAFGGEAAEEPGLEAEPASGPEAPDEADAAEEAGSEEPPAPGQGDEADTKLDLARAYIDLGDEAGARELLEEVLEEGTEAQRESARQVLSGLSDGV